MTQEEKIVLLTESIELVLLFHSGTFWDAAKAEQWRSITGNAEATTKVLCDHLRKVLKDIEKE